MNISKIQVGSTQYDLKDKYAARVESADSSATLAGFNAQSDSLWKAPQTLTASEKTQVKYNLGLIQEFTNIYSAIEATTDSAGIYTSYTIDQREIDGNAKLPEDIITLHSPSMNATELVYINGKAEYKDVIARIRANSHLYIGRYNTTTGKLEAKQVSDADKTKWVDGTSIVWGEEDDLFMKLPTFWWKCEEHEEDIYKITFCAEQSYTDNTWNCWEGNTFIGVYEAVIDNGKVYSKSGVTPTVNQSWTDFTAYARARYNNNNYRLITYEAHLIMALLGYGWFGNTHSQSIIGSGTSSYPKTTGLTNSKGMNDSKASVDGNTTSINFWGLENWWGDISEWIDNIKTRDTNGNVNILGDDRSAVLRTVSCPGVSDSNKCITKIQLGQNGDVLPKEIVTYSNYNRGFCDYGRVYSAAGCVAYRSYYAANPYGGLSCLFVNYDASAVNAALGSRLLYKGDYEVVENFSE